MTNLSATTYQEAEQLLNARGAPLARKVGNNTTIEFNTSSDGERIILVRLHGHGIVMLHAGGDVSVRDCGYVTQTTYDRLYQFVLPLGYTARFQQGTGYVFNGGEVHDDVHGVIWLRLSPVPASERR